MDNNRFTLDTNFILYLFQGKPGPAKFLNEKEGLEIYVSIITQTELLAFPDMTHEEYQRLCDFLDEVEIVPYTSELLTLTIDFRKKTRRKLPDSIIAATSIHANAPLVTYDNDLAKTSFPNFAVITPES